MATGINVLLGLAVTEVTRREDDYWEMFAGAATRIQKEEMRVISLGTMLATNSSLTRALQLKIGKGLWRDSIDDDWNNWE